MADYIIHTVEQGSAEWLALREDFLPASEAPFMLGASKYKSRKKYLEEKRTGTKEVIDERTQALFDRGHAAEEVARPYAEDFAELELKPLVLTLGKLLASFDGVNLEAQIGWEHKLWNQSIVDYITEHQKIPDTHWPQLAQQCYVGNLKRILFTLSEGDNEFHFWYERNETHIEQVLDGWDAFEADLERDSVIDLEADPELRAKALELRHLHMEKQNITKRYAELDAELKALGQQEHKDLKGCDIEIAWQKGRKTFNKKRLLADHPEIDEAQYTDIGKDTQVTRIKEAAHG